MPELLPHDANMLKLIDLLKEAGMIRYREEFYETIGVNRQYIAGVRNGTRYFTAEQIGKTCKAYKVRADWIYGITAAMFIHSKIAHF